MSKGSIWSQGTKECIGLTSSFMWLIKGTQKLFYILAEDMCSQLKTLNNCSVHPRYKQVFSHCQEDKIIVQWQTIGYLIIQNN